MKDEKLADRNSCTSKVVCRPSEGEVGAFERCGESVLELKNTIVEQNRSLESTVENQRSCSTAGKVCGEK